MERHLDLSSLPDGALSCGSGRHEDVGGICRACGEWLPHATCRAPGCGWTAALGERTHQEAVRHLCATGHAIRVLVN
ncbi:hypothetical protein ACIHIX_43395 [Streptomyces sp. NPDC051913]|uniref:hypothetical protein n=1 Tax=Streptomyces sp. NPDC051913 TaxID=3365676 RepID=UPI0037D91776